MASPSPVLEKAPLWPSRPAEYPRTWSRKRARLSALALLVSSAALFFYDTSTVPILPSLKSLLYHGNHSCNSGGSLISASNGRISKDGVTGRLPALGWNSWNEYACKINESVFLTVGELLVSTGLRDLGYRYVNIDDCWSDKDNQRDEKTHEINVDKNKFPNGMKHLADKMHDLGLKIGIYSDAGSYTCAGYAGSLGYEKIDAAQWARWGIDYLKYDNCNVPQEWWDEYEWYWPEVWHRGGAAEDKAPDDSVQTLRAPAPPDYDWSTSNTSRRYIRMREALEKQDRVIQYGLCPWGRAHVDLWGNNTGQSWRMFADIVPIWSGTRGGSKGITDILNHASFFTNTTDFFGHGDYDMLEVGNGDLTIEENRSHFALWAALKSPLIIGTPLDGIKPEILEILSNKDLIAFNQDPLYGPSASPYKWGINPDGTYNDTHPAEYWSGLSSKGTHVFMLNTLDKTVSKAAVWKEIPGLDKQAYRVRDMWTGQDLGIFGEKFQLNVAAHDTVAIQINEVEDGDGSF